MDKQTGGIRDLLPLAYLASPVDGCSGDSPQALPGSEQEGQRGSLERYELGGAVELAVAPHILHCHLVLGQGASLNRECVAYINYLITVARQSGTESQQRVVGMLIAGLRVPV
jgi:hypothetical protein